jgi:hypothetical protein
LVAAQLAYAHHNFLPVPTGGCSTIRPCPHRLLASEHDRNKLIA